MLYRNFKQVSTGDFLDVVFTTAGDAFTTSPDTHIAEIGVVFPFIWDTDIVAVDSDHDQSIGSSPLEQTPPAAPPAVKTLEQRVAALEKKVGI